MYIKIIKIYYNILKIFFIYYIYKKNKSINKY